MAQDFSQYTNVPLGDMKRVTLPEGHYFGTVKDYELKESAQAKKPMLVFKFSLSSAGEDVQADQLPAEGVAGKVVTANYMLDQDFGRDDIRKVIEATVPGTDPTQGFGGYLPQTKGQPVKLYIKPRNLEKDNPDAGTTDDVKKVMSATA